MSFLNIIKNLGLFGCFFLTTAYGQTMPNEMSALINKNMLNGSLLVIDKLDEEQHQFFWKNTTLNSQGYLEIETSPEYLNVIEELAKKVNLKNDTSEFPLNIYSLRNFFYIGSFKESDNRTNFIFKSFEKNSLLATIWNYKTAGAKIVLVKEFFNQTVNKENAVLSFSINKSLNFGLWKLSWWTDNLSYEIYVLDNIDSNRKPRYSPQDILSIATELTKVKDSTP